MAMVGGMATAMARATTAGPATMPHQYECGQLPFMAAEVATTATVVSGVVMAAFVVAPVAFTGVAGAAGGKLSVRLPQ
jgi:hypothetical protein